MSSNLIWLSKIDEISEFGDDVRHELLIGDRLTIAGGDVENAREGDTFPTAAKVEEEIQELRGQRIPLLSRSEPWIRRKLGD